MGEFVVRVATPADADRLWPLVEATEGKRVRLVIGSTLRAAERRRSRLVARLLDIERPVLVAYSGIQAVGYLPLPEGPPHVRSGWEGLGVDFELTEYLR
jgi:hypothetical protein